MAASLFFVYAFHSEAIFWILGRSASLGTLFFLPAVIFYLKRYDHKAWFILSITFFTAGLFAYESVWVFPLLIALVAFADKKIAHWNLRREVSFISTVWIIFLLYMIIRYSLINEVAGGYEASAFIEFDVVKLASNFARVVYRCFAPPAISNSGLFSGIAIFLLLAAAIYSALKKGNSTLIILLFCFLLISFLPYLSLGINTRTVEGERYLYMPSIFAAIFLIAIISSLVQKHIQFIIVWSILLLVHLFFLNKSRLYYTSASEISRTTYQQINGLKNKSRLFIDSLPPGVNGALIFRLGFDEGLKWLHEKGNVDSVFILSVKQINHFSQPYNIINKSTGSGFIVDAILIRDSTQKQTYIPKRIIGFEFNPITDARFIFSDSGLVIIK
jgi:hypothetical protein